MVLPEWKIFLQEAVLDGRSEQGIGREAGRGSEAGRSRFLRVMVPPRAASPKATARQRPRVALGGSAARGGTACLFCGIVQRTVPATVVAEEPGLLAFTDIHPRAPTHLLVIPTEHVASADDWTAAHGALIGRMLLFAVRLARERGLVNGYRLVINCGPEAGQSVAHVHLHVLGGRRLGWPPG
jgi:histidine triad (HIT) family protein